MHVTVRVLPHVWNLRSGRSGDRIKAAAVAGSRRFGFRLTEFSIQGNHIHLLVEAPDRGVLAQGMKGLNVRIARRLNKMMGTTGRVLADRYHTHVLKTPTEVRNAVHYLRNNHRRHVPSLPATFVDEYASFNLRLDLPRAVTWPLKDL
jgi:REP element-mobilizing transposase RayT